jgi:hypothetical protein
MDGLHGECELEAQARIVVFSVGVGSTCELFLTIGSRRPQIRPRRGEAQIRPGRHPHTHGRCVVKMALLSDLLLPCALPTGPMSWCEG